MQISPNGNQFLIPSCGCCHRCWRKCSADEILLHKITLHSYRIVGKAHCWKPADFALLVAAASGHPVAMIHERRWKITVGPTGPTGALKTKPTAPKVHHLYTCGFKQNIWKRSPTTSPNHKKKNISFIVFPENPLALDAFLHISGGFVSCQPFSPSLQPGSPDVTLLNGVVAQLADGELRVGHRQHFATDHRPQREAAVTPSAVPGGFRTRYGKIDEMWTKHGVKMFPPQKRHAIIKYLKKKLT